MYKEQEFRYHPEQKVYEGEILPPLPKPAVRVQDGVQVEERLKVIRTELIHYIEKPPPPPRVIVVERQAPAHPESVWEELGGAVMDGVAGVRGFLGEMTPIWRGLRR
jgi:hypothetical protein